jgi:hypothetical protein
MCVSKTFLFKDLGSKCQPATEKDQGLGLTDEGIYLLKLDGPVVFFFLQVRGDTRENQDRKEGQSLRPQFQ